MRTIIAKDRTNEERKYISVEEEVQEGGGEEEVQEGGDEEEVQEGEG